MTRPVIGGSPSWRAKNAETPLPPGRCFFVVGPGRTAQETGRRMPETVRFAFSRPMGARAGPDGGG
jgi:hypothetical protein